MALTCRIQPRNSKLFPELNEYFKDRGFSKRESREITKDIWENAVNIPFQKALEIDDFYDNPECVFNEPTIETIKDKLNLDDIVSRNDTIRRANHDLGNNGKNRRVYDTYTDAANTAVNYNTQHPLVNVKVLQTENGYVLKPEKKSPQNMADNTELVFNSELCNNLLTLTHSIGFDVRLEELVTENGKFDPSAARKTSQGLIDIIQIAKGAKGEKAFPEEYSHMVVAGTKKYIITQRLLNALEKNDTYKAVLGDDYENYENRYGNETKEGLRQRLIEEAAGKLLRDKLIDNSVDKSFSYILDRVWNNIKSIFRKTNVSEVQKAIADAENSAYRLAKRASKKSIIKYIDKQAVLDSKPLYDIEQKITKQHKLAEKQLEILRKKMSLARRKSTDGRYSNKDMRFYHTLSAQMKTMDYYNMNLNFIQECNSEYHSIMGDLRQEMELRDNPDADSRSDIKKLAQTAKILRSFIKFSRAYSTILKELGRMNSLYDEGETNLTMEQAKNISDIAKELYDKISDNIDTVIKEMKFNVVLDFLRYYAGDNLLQKVVEGDKESKDMIESLLKRCSDVRFLESTVGAVSNCSDVILQLVDKAVRMQQAQRDDKLVDFKNSFAGYVSNLIAKGYDPNFILERDSNGKMTGRLISDIDWERYENDKKKAIEEIDRKYADKGTAYKMQALDSWVKQHTREEQLLSVDMYGNEVKTDSQRTERIPNDNYLKPESERIAKLPKDMRDFYYRVMFIKRSLDATLPASETSLYLAPQKLNNMLDAALKKDKKGKALATALKNEYIIREDLGEKGFMPMMDEIEGAFSDEKALEEYKKQINTDLDGTPLQEIPLYLNKKVEDPDTLSDDFAGAFMAYAGMVYNYIGMNEIIDLLEITRDYITNDRQYTEASGIKIEDTFKVMGEETTIIPTLNPKETRTAKWIDKYFEMVVYGKMKMDEHMVIGDKIVDTGAMLDALKAYTSALGMGLNVFAGISNSLMGKVQLLIESVGAENFNVKDFARAAVEYDKMIWEYLGEMNQISKKSKMSLIIDKFDMLEDFFNNAKYEEYYASPIKRIIGKTNIFILNNMGEHMLHTQGSFAMLMHQKVRIKKKEKWEETTLYDAYEVKSYKDEGTEKDKGTGAVSYDIVLPYETELIMTDKDGNNTYIPFTKDEFYKLKIRMQRVNKGMHGGFTDADRGQFQNRAIGRLVTQFRQWMPEYYNKRWGIKSYDVILDQDSEGFYRTVLRFLVDTFRDVKRGQFELKTIGQNLKDWEKANIKKVSLEMGLFIGLLFLIKGLGELKDKKGYWTKRMLAYQLRRIQMEIGVAAPTLTLWENIKQVIQSPAAAVNSFDGVLNVLALWNLFEPIESGRYEGWSKYHRDVYRAIPLWGQIRKALDVKDEDYMFTIFNFNRN